jgi:Ras-related protein Rab-28
MASSRGDPAIKLILLGNGSVGKSSLIARFVDDGFTRIYKQTIGLDFYEKKLQFPRDQRLVLQVWDIGGQTINSKMIGKYLFGVHVALLCYDVTDAQSFSDADDWLRVARRYSADAKALGDRPLHVHLVGNKIDLIAHRVISSEKHDAFIRTHELQGGFLMSARSGDNVLKSIYKISAAAAKIQVSDFELSFCDKIVRVTIPAEGGGDDEARTAMADAIEAEDRAFEQRKKGDHGARPHRFSGRDKCVLM